MSDGYTFTCRCIHCGGTLHHQADGSLRPAATACLAACELCGQVHRIDVRLTPLIGQRAAVHTEPADIQSTTEFGRQLIQTIHNAEDNK